MVADLRRHRYASKYNTITILIHGQLDRKEA